MVAAKVFFSYSHVDEALRDQLEVQLSALKRQKVIETWHDRRIQAGQEFAGEIDEHANLDDIILLLVSPDFIASDYCIEIEVQRAMERQESGDAIVIPVILRACDWKGLPFGKLQGVPRDAKPITKFADRDEAMLEVAVAVRKAAENLAARRGAPSTVESAPRPVASPPMRSLAAPPAAARSSNLGLRKTFTDRDKDAYRQESFEYIARFFEGSLQELNARNPGYEGAFRRAGTDRFMATVYLEGKAVARCTVFIGDGSFTSGIGYVTGESSQSNSFNEMLSVDADDESLFLRSMGMSAIVAGRERGKLTQEGGAELLWGMLIQGLQARR